LARLVSDLPPPNYALLRSLTAHLILIVKHSHINKMTLRNIGIVFSPTLGIPAGIFSELVSHFGAIFDAEEEVPEEVEPVIIPPDSGQEEPQGGGDGDETIRRNRNSVLYQAAGADALLGLGGRSLDPSKSLLYSTCPDIDLIAIDDSASEASIVDYESETHSQSLHSHHSQSGQSSDNDNENDESSASPTTPKAKVDHYPSASAVRRAKAAARGLDLGPSPVSNPHTPSRRHGNGHGNGDERGNGYTGQGQGHEGLPANSHSHPVMEGVAR
jgi:RalA-binding protein 1